MPYYAWRGVDLMAALRKGATFASSAQELDTLLFSQDIALLSCTEKPVHMRFFRFTERTSELFFEQLGSLLSSGLLLPAAMRVIAQQAHSVRLQKIIFDLQQAVMQGIPLSKAFERSACAFSPLVIHVVRLGQEVGNLGFACTQLSDYCGARQRFKRKVARAALMPLVTLGFFCVIALVIFVVIIPQFSTFFASFSQELPPLTRYIVAVSDFVRSTAFLWALVGFLLIALCLCLYMRTKTGRSYKDRGALGVPGVRAFVLRGAGYQFLQSLSLLLNGGMRLLPAVRIAREGVGNSVIRADLGQLVEDIYCGVTLAAACSRAYEGLFTPDTIALLRIGHESGKLPQMVQKAADAYAERIERSLSFIAFVIQPLLMVFIGFLIALLIIAIYMPIMSLSSVI